MRKRLPANAHRRRPLTSRLLAYSLLVGSAVTASVSSVAPAPTATAAGATVSAASTNPAFTKTETVTRDHLLVDGTDQLADTRTVSVAVSQTTSLRERQEIAVSWSGAHPTGGLVADQNSQLAAEQEYPVVIMECRGSDSTSVPAAQQLSPATCWTHTPEERFQSDYSNLFPPFRIDRYALTADRNPGVGVPSPLPPACGLAGSGVQHWIPFVAADGTVYPGGLNGCAGIPPEAVNYEQSLLPSNTTYASTDKTGNGNADFVVSTAETNASLGCSQTVTCSLVVIPIMGISCDPGAAGQPPQNQPTPRSAADDAFKLCSGTGNYLPGQLSYGTSGLEDVTVSGDLWWSASNWRNRISVPLTFAPPPDACSLTNPSKPTFIYGSELMGQATQQWSPAFCLDPKLFKFQHVQTGEPEAKNLLSTGTIEAALQAAPPDSPFPGPVVQAPVAATGFAIAFAIDGKDGQPIQQLKLTPRLLAKLLTESYPVEPVVRNYDPPLQNNPYNIAWDPEFQALNPGIPIPSLNDIPAATLFTISSDSDVIWALTSYINADPTARAWLDGTPDPWGTVVNPAYKAIKLPVAGWPLLDTFASGPAYTSNNPCFFNNPIPYLQLVASPVSNMSTVTINMQFGIANSQLKCYNPGLQDQKLVALGRESPGQRFLLGVVPLADAARYRMSTAALQSQVSTSAPTKFTDASGRTFVAPDDASLAAAVALFHPNTDAGTWLLDYGKFQTDTAAVSAYPGTVLISADIPTSGLPATDAQHYATFLDWAVTTGQTPGADVGNLPGGYLPLTAANGLGDEARYTHAAALAVAAQAGDVPPLIPAAVAPSSGSAQTPANAAPSGPPPDTSGGTDMTAPASISDLAVGGGSASSQAASGSSAGSPPAHRVQPARSAGRTLAFGAGIGGLALPISMGLFLVGGAGSIGARLTRRFRGSS